jgi:PAS domain S-box-containing protein
MSAPIRILHLEDDPVDARLIGEQLLKKSALDVVLTLVGTREAFETELLKGDVDLVLSDYHLPGFNGLDALAIVRSRAPQIPFILVTGALGDERAVEVLRSGATDFVLKDRLARLAPAIQRALSERAVQRWHEEAQAQLEEAQQLSKLAAAAARMGTWQLDAESGKLECSDEFLSLIGVQRAEWGGTASALETLVHPEDVERCRATYDEANTHGGFAELEFRIRKPGGEVRWMYCRCDRWRRSHGGRALLLGVMMDITARKRMEEALRDAARRKDQFLAMLAHELRNPLAPISHGLYLLRRSAAQTADAERIHAMLERQMKHTIRLVDDLLDASRITLGKIELKRSPVEVTTVVHGAVEMSRPLIEGAHHRLDVSLPPESLILDADPVRLTQALSNLLNNAAKYTEEGGQIWVAARRSGTHVEISVRDTGSGIPKAMLDRVFDLYIQGQNENGHTRPGLGIGLTMVRLLVDMHGGRVEARSDGAGKGSEFLVRLPLARAQSSLHPTPATQASSMDLRGYRILVVDDNQDSADSLAMLLRASGAKAQATYDGVSALEVISSQQPDVVVLDLGMPGMDGYSVAHQIRQNLCSERVTLIALSGWGQEQDRLRSLAVGFDHHLTKPIDLNALQGVFASLRSTKQDRIATKGF